MLDITIDALIDSAKLIPFLFVTYLFMEWLEHKTKNGMSSKIKKAGRLGPLIGGVLGVVPQCGFSAAASSLFSGRVITTGTLIAIFMSTSDEMLPILISEAVSVPAIAKFLSTKVLIAIVSGFIIELLLCRRQAYDIDIHTVCEEEHCNCKDGILLSALKHTLKIFIYILLFSFLLNSLLELIGENALENILSSAPFVGILLASLVGLIPNCASSVVITQMYLSSIISPGAMMAGLLVNSGVGLLVLFRLNRHVKENISIVSMLYILSVLWGLLIEIIGITF